MEPRAAYLAVREAAATLELAPTTVGTALGYRHRRGESDAARELESVLPACVFLAAKVEEEPRRMRDVLNAFHAARHDGELLRDSREYWRLKEALVLEEQQLLLLLQLLQLLLERAVQTLALRTRRLGAFERRARLAHRLVVLPARRAAHLLDGC